MTYLCDESANSSGANMPLRVIELLGRLFGKKSVFVSYLDELIDELTDCVMKMIAISS